MPNYTCSQCQAEAAWVHLSLIQTGDTQALCLGCLPPSVAALWSMAGLPELVFDITDQSVAQTETDEDAGGQQAPREGEGLRSNTEPQGDGSPTPVPDWPTGDLETGPQDDEADTDGPDEATPEEPGVIEMIERREGKRAVRPNHYRRSGGDAHGKGADESVETQPSPAAHDHG